MTAAELHARNAAGIERTRRLRDMRARAACQLAVTMQTNAGGRPAWDRAEESSYGRATALASYVAYERAESILWILTAPGDLSPDFVEIVHHAVGHLPGAAIAACLEYAEAVKLPA